MKELNAFANITPGHLLFIVVNAIIGLCIVALFLSILINFMEAKERLQAREEKKSIVATGTMTLFFFFFYGLIRFQIGAFTFVDDRIRSVLMLVGLAAILLGCVVNIKGRLNLGGNWANQIRIYEDQALVTTGVYKIVRHPLYASLIWMFYGACLVYHNVAAFASTTLIFIPFMYYRAKQEENMLNKRFGDYQYYQETTGMFFPKIFFPKRGNTNEGK